MTTFNNPNVLAQGGRYVMGMTSDSSGNVWFSEADLLGLIAPGDQPQVFNLGPPILGGNIQDLVPWFPGTLLSPDTVEHVLNVLSGNGQFSTLLVPGVQPGLGAIAVDRKANAWFISSPSNVIVQLTFPGSEVSRTPTESFIRAVYQRATGVPIMPGPQGVHGPDRPRVGSTGDDVICTHPAGAPPPWSGRF